jgi:hypothetical protein
LIKIQKTHSEIFFPRQKDVFQNIYSRKKIETRGIEKKHGDGVGREKLIIFSRKIPPHMDQDMAQAPI